MDERAGPAAVNDCAGVILDGLSGLDADDIPAHLAQAAATSGIANLVIYLADLSEDVLIPWSSGDGLESVDIDGTLAGRVYRRAEPAQGETGHWWFPLGDGSQRLGVLAFTCDAEPERTLTDGRRLAALAGLLLISRSSYCDSIEKCRRRRDITIAAELRWALMPPRDMTSRQVTLAGVLEPAYEIAGDSFDYALDQGRLSVGVFDAMGHGLTASRLANLAITSYRHSRRTGLDLANTYRAMDRIIADAFGEANFVTGHFAQLDTTNGALTVVNAGHPRPLLIREGTAHTLTFRPATPVGTSLTDAEVGTLQLQPGDSILMHSDGVTEARAAGGDVFGTERLGDLAVRAVAAGETTAETVRRLIRSVIEHRGLDLEDDATLLMYTWHPAQDGEMAGLRTPG